MNNESNTLIIVNNNKICPVCGSEMKREKSDNPHNVYVGNYTCANQACAVSVVVRN